MERFRNLAEVWRQLRTLDPKAAGWIILAAAGGLALGGGVGFLLSLWAIVPMALLTGVLAALIVFNIRARRAMYGAIEGQLGAAAAVLQQMRGAWFVTPAVAMNGKQDLVHRVVGRPGVVLVGEGAAQRVKGLLAQERKRLSRAVGDVPIHTLVVGDGEDLVPLAKLQARVTKLPAKLRRKDVAKLERRLKPLTRALPIPGGIDPTAVRRGRPKSR
ncbi:MAG: DUF4191 domain-containing protein [Actinomycetota bacterium]|nr:DUF4191 domain-containing protein [Actinomycetota bacterium]